MTSQTSKILITGSVLTAFLLSAVAVLGEPLASPKLRIGVVGPLTGALQPVGVSLKNSVIMADHLLDTADQVEFIFEDDGFDPKQTVSAVTKLITADHVKGLIVFGSGTAMAIADIAERSHIPTMALSMSDKVVEGRQSIYRLFLTANAQTRVIENEVKIRHYPSLAIVASSHEAMIRLRDRFLDTHPANVILSEELVPSDTDLRAVALRVKTAGPKAVYLLMMPPQLSSFAKQLREAGYKGELFSTIQAQNLAEVKAAAGAMEGLWFSTFDDSEARWFYDQYKTAFAEPAMPDGLFGFDAAKLFIQGATSSDVLSSLVAVKNFSGLLGDYDISEYHTFVPATALKAVEGQGFKYIKKTS